MKMLMKLFVTFSIILFTACKKDNTAVLIKGKVLHRSCATIAIQILDQNFYYLGQASWQQTPSKPIHQNVFAVVNQCSFPGGIAEGQEITFRVISHDPTMKDCAVCGLWDNPPSVKQMITVVND